MSGRPRGRRLLVTRPAADAASLAEALAARGIEVLIEPMLSIEIVTGPTLDLDGVQALLVTSANGARALARRTRVRDLPVLAVGEASACAARGEGFARVESAGGDAAALAALAIDRLDPGAGALLHAAASDVAGDLAGRLGGAGFAYRREVLYRARATERLSPAAVAALREGGVDGVLFFSPRTAATFVTLMVKAGLAISARRLDAYCLSPAVAEAAEKLTWKRVAVAARPEQGELLTVIDRAGTTAADSGNLHS